MGNDAADAWAKRAATKGRPSPADLKEWDLLKDWLRAYLRFAARMYMLWVPVDATKRRNRADSGRNRAGGAADKKAHALVYNARLRIWKCAACWRSYRFRATAEKDGCKPLRAARNDIATRAIGKGHVLWRADYRAGPGQVIFCSRCGCYAEQRAKLLRERCTGSKTARSRTFVAHWEAGRHPHNFRDVDLAGRVRFCLGSLPERAGTGLGGVRNHTASPGASGTGRTTLGQRSQGGVRRALLRCAFDDPEWEPGEEEEPEPVGEEGPPEQGPFSHEPFSDGPC